MYADKIDVANKIQNENIPKACVGNVVLSTCDNKIFFWGYLHSILIYNMLNE